jgi:hypothetical protein
MKSILFEIFENSWISSSIVVYENSLITHWNPASIFTTKQTISAEQSSPFVKHCHIVLEVLSSAIREQQQQKSKQIVEQKKIIITRYPCLFTDEN